MEEKLKHLEFIQNVITRLNTNSFYIKGWAISIISALFVFADKNSNSELMILVYAIIPMFWILDSFFLSSERRYRELYKEVASSTTTDFNMSTDKYKVFEYSWIKCFFSRTLLVFYLFLVLMSFIAMCILIK